MSDVQWRGSRSPLIFSAFSAEREAEEWLVAGQVRRFEDAVGGVWMTEATEDFVPSPLRPESAERRLWITHLLTASAADLVRQGVCDSSGDERLLQLLGDRSLQVRMKAKPIQAAGPDAMRIKLTQYFDVARVKIKGADFILEKRRALESLVRSVCSFGGREIINTPVPSPDSRGRKRPAGAPSKGKD